MEPAAVVVEPVVAPVVEPEPLPAAVVVEPVVAPVVEPDETEKKGFPWWILAVLGILVIAILLWHPWTVRTAASAPTAQPATAIATKTLVPTEPAVTQSAMTQDTATQTAQPANTPVAPVTDGKALAEQILGKTLPWPPETYASHQGEEGYPDICAGLCWDTSKLADGIMVNYGPNAGEEDITQSDASFGDGSTGPLELMRNGTVTTVVFANATDAQLEICAIGTLDGKPLTEVLGINEGECGKRVALSAGWHVIEGNANSPIAGFGVRYTANGWSGLTESQIVEYTGYWKIVGDTATWTGPSDIEIMMTPTLVQMMQNFDALHTVVFTTTMPGKVLFCNGTVSGSATLTSPDGACHMYEVPAGTFTYTGEARLSAGIGWQPAK
jgi:hypothetical protein